MTTAHRSTAGFRVTLTALTDLIGWEGRFYACQIIERLRPGAGHVWLPRHDPPVCSMCGASMKRKGVRL